MREGKPGLKGRSVELKGGRVPFAREQKASVLMTHD